MENSSINHHHPYVDLAVVVFCYMAAYLTHITNMLPIIQFLVQLLSLISVTMVIVNNADTFIGKVKKYIQSFKSFIHKKRSK